MGSRSDGAKLKRRLEESASRRSSQDTKSDGKKPKMALHDQVQYFRELVVSAKGTELGRWKQSDVKNATKWATFFERKKKSLGAELVPLSCPMKELLSALLSNPLLSDQHFRHLIAERDKLGDIFTELVARQVQQRGSRSSLATTISCFDSSKVPLASRVSARLLRRQHRTALAAKGEQAFRAELRESMRAAPNSRLEELCLELGYEPERSVLHKILEDELVSFLLPSEESVADEGPRWTSLGDDVLRAASTNSRTFFLVLSQAVLKRTSGTGVYGAGNSAAEFLLSLTPPAIRRQLELQDNLRIGDTQEQNSGRMITGRVHSHHTALTHAFKQRLADVVQHCNILKPDHGRTISLKSILRPRQIPTQPDNSPHLHPVPSLTASSYIAPVSFPIPSFKPVVDARP